MLSTGSGLRMTRIAKFAVDALWWFGILVCAFTAFWVLAGPAITEKPGIHMNLGAAVRFRYDLQWPLTRATLYPGGVGWMGPALAGLLVLVLSAAWRYGAELQQEHDHTL